jgi:hypothetical protein
MVGTESLIHFSAIKHLKTSGPVTHKNEQIPVKQPHTQKNVNTPKLSLPKIIINLLPR